jgi:hypothetical protein
LIENDIIAAQRVFEKQKLGAPLLRATNLPKNTGAKNVEGPQAAGSCKGAP